MGKDYFDEVSINELEDFKGHPMYVAMMETFKERIELLRNDLEMGIVRTEDGNALPMNHDSLIRTQGETRSLRYATNLIDLLIRIKQEPITKENKNG